MKEQKKKKYVSPSMKVTRVEMEEGFMKASVLPRDDGKHSVESTGHELGNTYDVSNWTNDEWK